MVVSPSLDQPARLDALTGLRFWFAFLVVLHHSLVHWFGPAAYVVADFGYIGVDFFFVLSGFVLTWSYRRGITARRFWWNRVSRIWPLHLTTLLLAVTVVGVGISRPGVLGTVANLLLLQAWSPDVHTYFGFNAVSWSLSCEVFFYLCFPWLARWLGNLDARARCWVVVGVTAALAVYPGAFSLTVAPRDAAGWEWTTYVLPLWRLGEFVVGIVAALAIRAGWRPRFSGRQALAVAGLLGGTLLAVGIINGHLPLRPPVEIVGMLVVAAVIVAVAHDELHGRRGILASRTMVRLGAASYALYLCHALVFAWLTSHWSTVGTGAWRFVGWATYAAVALGCAFALHHGIEVPCERWLRRRSWSRGRRGWPPPSSPRSGPLRGRSLVLLPAVTTPAVTADNDRTPVPVR